ncbi:MAG: CpsB/CapC family capsule biosynthesis tyrosine phosphatase [Victivallales bacterium]|jgi:protein-tyrosine phosphatase
MIDIHSHLLYGVDDGSRSFDSSVEMLKAAAKDGVKSIVLTPHFSPGLFETAHGRFERLVPEAENLDIKLFFGCEYDFSHLNTQESLITLGDKGSYVLIDFCLSPITLMTKNILLDWQMRDYRIIIAHPERLFDKNALSDLKDLADENIYFQLNAGSFAGNYGRRVRRFAKKLLKKGLCHFIASDAHSVKNYSGQIPACRKYVAKRLSPELEKVLFEENPRRMLTGRPLISIW